MDIRYRNSKEDDICLECGFGAGDGDTLQDIFEKLSRKARDLAVSDPSAQQAVAVLVSTGNISGFANHDVVSGNGADEAAFIDTLRESGDTEVRYAVCMWQDSAIDVPSRHLRDLLAELNPLNRKMHFFLASGDGIAVKALDVMHPQE